MKKYIVVLANNEEKYPGAKIAPICRRLTSDMKMFDSKENVLNFICGIGRNNLKGKVVKKIFTIDSLGSVCSCKVVFNGELILVENIEAEEDDE